MPDSLITLAGRLITNGIRFRCLRASGKVQKPSAVSIEVTHQCIARCIMCNIWRIPRDTPSLSAQDWLALLSRDLFSDLVELDITGGEPFLRKDLSDLLTSVCELKKSRLASLRSIAVTTNGFLTRRVLEESRKILFEARCADVDLVMVCAMDAVGDVHDGVRNVPGGWRRVDQTIQGLKRLRAEFSNLIIGLKTTVLPITVGQLDAIVRYAKKNDLFTIISPCIITRGRYLNPDRAEDLAFTPEQVQEMTRFFQKQASRWSFHEECLVRYFQTGQMKKACSCGFNYFFIRSHGALFPCPMIDASPGNVAETPVETLLASDAAVRIRRQAGRFPECRHCTEPGLERYSLPCEGWTYLSLLPKMGRKRFLHMHHHMGLDKYFTQGAACFHNSSKPERREDSY
ncbi:radical SAM protein [Desulfococcus sp.]|uniref:radical SAM protein n=1 Tax=Desulfococcus sp. TaxID=2025834 RepID=UPI00359431DD